MQLVDPETAELIYNEMGPGREISGGSAANTLAGMAALGMKCGFIGQVCDDQLGGVFTHDIRSLGIDYRTEPRSGEPSTARRSEEHTSELQSLMRISYAVFCLKKKKTKKNIESLHVHNTTTREHRKYEVLHN